MVYLFPQPMRAPIYPSRLCPAFFLAITLLIGARLPAADTPAIETVKCRIDPKTVVGRIAPDFIGLGYESSAVAQSNYFSAKNTRLVQLYRNLTPHGLIRIGGNVSDHTRYEPDGTPAARTERETTIITKANLVDLGKFTRATGWKVMWGLNLGSGSKAGAVEEALAVRKALGSRLQSFEIGNEVDFHARFSRNFDAYHAAYLDYKSAIRSALPRAPFSGPDSASSVPWCLAFANAEGNDMKLLTCHYYRGGSRDTQATIPTLLKHDDAWDARLIDLQKASRDHRVNFRINEVNSFSGGGKPGVSDTFASALWSLDYMFVLATYGCAGINLETDLNQLGFISHYSPIVHDADGICHARPEYYGMLAFALAGNGDLLKLTLEKGEINLSAYATRDAQNHLWLTVINQDLTRDAALEAILPRDCATAAAFRLQAPSVGSTNGTTLAGTEVSTDGKWPADPRRCRLNRVPPACWSRTPARSCCGS